ncbi:phage tail protein [Allosphingosinicella vermicomposti]|uniref:phage tail protein n=1 Tax=Allosphingosinicella vermicomposti TaxID=614671 RepID=UPI000D0F1330|nr:phage tail protein [Allosphingosinicella vermicomposti]
MATLVFTAVGTAIGGPIGGMIGAMVGQQVDGALFAPKARQGPRLGDLAVQTSSYGSHIPKIFGTVRAAGTVIWATDLKESRSTSGGGKGKPKVTSYSYSASFAVAISGRRIADVRRIWADGKLLRGAAGDFKSRTKYRLYRGTEEQAPDPMIASREGIGSTSAFRGIAYAVFEDFQLADYGNRIPSLTFEIVADDGAVNVAAMASELSGGVMTAGSAPSIGGYAASGDSIAGAIEPLIDAMPLSLQEGADGDLRIGSLGEAMVELAASDTGVWGPGDAGGRAEFSRKAPGLTPADITIAYHDPARDYQTGLQRAVRGEANGRAERRAMPATLSAGMAKGFAEYRLKTAWSRREAGKAHIGWREVELTPGRLVTLEGRPGLWRVGRTTFDRMVVTADLLRVPGGAPQIIDATPGRATGEEDAAHGGTMLVVADLPLGDDAQRTKPLLFVAAAGRAAGWRQAELILSYDGGTSWEAVGITAGPAAMGILEQPLPAAGSAMLDLINTIEVALPHDGMWLESCDDDALAAGRNLALVGQELIQFGAAEPLGGGHFRLSRLLRGRRGTEWAAGTAGAGAPFVLLETDSLSVIEPPIAMIGANARIVGQGIGDAAEGVAAECVVSGEAIRPPAPVHLRAIPTATGLELKWVRRSRSGWAWLDGGDTPMGEEGERYEVRLSGAGFERRVETTEPAFLYGPAARAADGHPASISVEIVQIGTLVRSRPATATFSL